MDGVLELIAGSRGSIEVIDIKEQGTFSNYWYTYRGNNKRNGPDHHFAMNYKTWKEMVERSRELEQSLGNGLKTVEKNELDTHIIQRRSVRTNKDLKKGKRISIKDLEFLRPYPRNSLKPYEIKKMIGKKLKKNKKKGSEFYINDF